MCVVVTAGRVEVLVGVWCCDCRKSGGVGDVCCCDCRKSGGVGGCVVL